MTTATQRQWTGRTDGLPWMHHTLIRILRYVNIRIVYAIMDIVIVFYMIFSHSYYISVYHYFRRRHNKSVLPSVWHTYLTFRQFGQVVIDRFAVYAGRHFEFEIEGNEAVEEAMRNGNGCIMLSSHVGNYEMAGYFLKPTRRMYALLFGGEKATILANRKRMFESNGISIITRTDDWSYLYQINDALTAGNMLTLMADRNFGSEKTVTCDVLGTPAELPLGPFALAGLYKQASVITVFVMKDSVHKYHIYVKQIHAASKNEYAKLFAAELTDIVSRYPHQWYNFFEFWNS